MPHDLSCFLHCQARNHRHLLRALDTPDQRYDVYHMWGIGGVGNFTLTRELINTYQEAMSSELFIHGREEFGFSVSAGPQKHGACPTPTVQAIQPAPSKSPAAAAADLGSPTPAYCLNLARSIAPYRGE